MRAALGAGVVECEIIFYGHELGPSHLFQTSSLLVPSSDHLPRPHGDGDQGDQALSREENKEFYNSDSPKTSVSPTSVKFDKCESSIGQVRQMYIQNT